MSLIQSSQTVRDVYVTQPQSAFRPLFLLRNRHVQTLLGARASFARPPPSRTMQVALGDGDRLALEVATPPRWSEGDRTAVLVHGLCGCHGSSYQVRLARKLYDRGVRAVRLNLRGCGSGEGLARRPYHSGRSRDVLTAIDQLRRETPDSSIDLIGFSLGGNIVLKMVGELGDRALGRLRHVIALCPPVNLLACAWRISRPAARVYEHYFVRLLCRSVHERHRRFPELGIPRLPSRLSLFEFDDLYTAPQCGFLNAVDYYQRASSAPLIPNIRVPTALLFAADDPLIDIDSLDHIDRPAHVELHKTTRGGHLGFLGRSHDSVGLRWMDSRILEWLNLPVGNR